MGQLAIDSLQFILDSCLQPYKKEVALEKSMKSKARTLLIVTAVTSLACLQANAVTVINLTNADRNSFATSAGIAGTVTAGAQSTTQLITYQVTDLDLAEDMSANDTLTVSILISATGGDVVDDVDAGGEQWGVTGGNDAEIDNGQGLSFALDSVGVSFGDAPGTATISFDGFTGLSSWFTGGDIATISGATVAPPGNFGGNRLHGNGGNVASDFDALSPTFEVLSTGTNTGGAQGFYLGNLDFQLTATPIPEPSVALLGGLSVLGLLRRRR